MRQACETQNEMTPTAVLWEESRLIISIRSYYDVHGAVQARLPENPVTSEAKITVQRVINLH